MIYSEAGILIYGGTSWSVTNFTVQDKLNKAIEIYEDNCKMIIDKINLEGMREADAAGDEWKSITSMDIGSKRWFELWVTSDAEDQARIDCLNITKYPPFPSVGRSIEHSSSIYFLETARCEQGIDLDEPELGY